jgi:hypothetical protein
MGWAIRAQTRAVAKGALWDYPGAPCGRTPCCIVGGLSQVVTGDTVEVTMPLLGHDISGSQIYTVPYQELERNWLCFYLSTFSCIQLACIRSPGEVGMYNRGGHYAD